MKSTTLLVLIISHQTWSWATLAFSLYPSSKPLTRSTKCSHRASTHRLGVFHSTIVQDAGEDTLPPSLHYKNDAAEPSSSSPYVIHKGRAIDMIKRCVSIEGLSLSKGWTVQATQAFQLAIEAVVRANPILTGKLVEVRTSPWPWKRKEIHVVPNVYNPSNHSFCTMLQKPVDILSPGDFLEDDVDEGSSGMRKLFEYMSSTFAPCMLDPPDFTFQQLKSESPLFQAKILDFGDGHAAYSIKMSHAIGDGTTYFQLVSQISAYMNGNEPEPIEWNNPLKSIHEIYPDNFTERDYHRSYGLPFGWGLAKNLRALPQRHCKYLLLSKDKILKVKNEMRKSKDASIINDDKTAQGRISTNDIVMSAICQLNGSSDVFAFDRSVRGIKEGINVYDAGNLFWEIPFDKEAGSDPVEIRKILLKDSSSFYDSDGVPLMPFLNGRVGRITSLATVTHQTTFPGSELLCQFPSASFINELPLDVAVIFKFNSDYWGIMHNFRKTKKSPLLEKIMA